MRTPGASLGTRTMLCRRWRSASGSVTPITMSSSQRGDIAPDVHHLRPVMTYASPSRSMRVAMFVAAGHRNRRADRAVQERLEPARLLLRRAEQGQQLHVAGVRCRAVERLRRD